jgi:transcription elongation GreA/GreB family factor
MKEVILSKKKFVELLKELDELHERRPEVLKQLNDARLLGDLSENAEYIEAKKTLREINIRLNDLTNLLKNVTVKDEKDNDEGKDYVDIFATVKLKNTNSNSEIEYSLVSEEESSLIDNKISITSPIGEKLKNKKVNDIIEINAPKGIIQFQIMSISY